MNEEKNTIENAVQGNKSSNILSRNKRMLALILTVTLIAIIGAVSYAYLPTDNLPNKPVDAQASTATLKLKYTDCASNNSSDCADISADLYPGDSISKTFEVENVGTQEVMYDIYFRELENSFKNGDLVYSLENMTTGKYLIREKVVKEGIDTNVIIKKKISAPVGSKVQYRLTVTFLNRDYEQSDNYDAIFSLKLKIAEAQKGTENMMAAHVSGEGEDISISEEGFWSHSADIKKIVFEDSLNPKENAAYSYDLSDSNSNPGSIMAYLIPDESDNTKYNAYIQGDGGVAAPVNSTGLFLNFTSLENIDNMEKFDTSNVTNMMAMFIGCIGLTSLDLSSFDTSNVTDMSYMFSSCSGLSSLYLSSFDTSNVTDMSYMFEDCGSLITLNLSSFDTSNVVNMRRMFRNCRSMTSLNISNFDTNNVVSMESMFYRCSSLTALDVSNFDTSNVTSMNSMFELCFGITSLDVSNFNTNKVADMSDIFRCLDLTSLDLSNFNTSNVTDMSGMFDGCHELTSLDLSNFDTSNVTTMSAMFRGCSGLTSLDLSNFNTSNVTSMYIMFDSCNNLTSLNLISFDTSNVIDMGGMFRNCGALTILDLSNFDTSKVVEMGSIYYSDYGMFYNCKSLSTTITIKNKDYKCYINMFSGAATVDGAKITVNYTADTSDLVDKMIATKSENSNVVKGSVVS